MIEFKPYESKPVTRMAFQINITHDFAKVGEAEWMIGSKGPETSNIIRFKAYEDPKIGDWIVRLTDEDTYHCSDAVFRERNIVPE